MKKNNIKMALATTLMGIGLFFPLTAHADKFDDEISQKQQAMTEKEKQIEALKATNNEETKTVTSLKEELKALATTYNQKNEQFRVLEDNYKLFLKDHSSKDDNPILKQVRPLIDSKEETPQFQQLMTEKKKNSLL